MGSPVDAVHWLVGALAEEGQQLRAGQIVFTGGLTAPFDLHPAVRPLQLTSAYLQSAAPIQRAQLTAERAKVRDLT